MIVTGYEGLDKQKTTVLLRQIASFRGRV